MTNSRAGKGMVLLDSHIATGAEGSYTFTPGVALDSDKYAKIIIVYTGRTTAALVLGIQLNGITTGTYFTSGTRVIMASHAQYAVSAADFGHLITAVIIDGQIHFQGTSEIYMTEKGAGDFAIYTHAGSATEHENSVCYNSGTLTSITSIKLITSTSTWETDTKIMIYGLQN